jgi:hypothetical protein
MKLERRILNWLPYIVLLIGAGVLVFYQGDYAKFETIILFVTLVAILFYVKDTRRLADISANQFQKYWIANLFVSLSVRLDGISKDVDNVSGANPDKWKEHKNEANALFDALKRLTATEEFAIKVDQERNKIERVFTLDKTIKESRQEALDIVREVKTNLQVLVGSSDRET